MTPERLEEIRDLLSEHPQGGRDGYRCLEAARELLAELDRVHAAQHPEPQEERELAAVRRHMADLAYPDTHWQLRPSDPESRWSDMVYYLLTRLEGRDAILTDILSDSGARLAGAAEERRRLVKLWSQTTGLNVGIFLEAVEALPSLPPPLPPAAARARADRLEKALRSLLDAVDNLGEGSIRVAAGLARDALEE